MSPIVNSLTHIQWVPPALLASSPASAKDSEAWV
jgi:hypothetical protein